MALRTATQLSNLFQAVEHALKNNIPILFRVRSSDFYPWENVNSNYAPTFMGMLNGSFEFSIDNKIYTID